MAKSSSHERMVTGYLRPCLQIKFAAYVKAKVMSKSEALNEAVRLLVEPQKTEKIIPSKNSY